MLNLKHLKMYPWNVPLGTPTLTQISKYAIAVTALCWIYKSRKISGRDRTHAPPTLLSRIWVAPNVETGSTPVQTETWPWLLISTDNSKPSTSCRGWIWRHSIPACLPGAATLTCLSVCLSVCPFLSTSERVTQGGTCKLCRVARLRASNNAQEVSTVSWLMTS